MDNGRLQALKELKMPVEYIVQNGLNIRHCVSMNINQTNWNLQDYIKSYADRGLKSYVLLQKLLDEFHVLKDMEIYAAATKNICCFNHVDIKNGDFTLTEDEYNNAKEKLNYIYETYKIYKKIPRVTCVIKAMIFCTNIAGVDLDRLKEKAIEYLDYGKMPPIPTADEAMQFLEDIYNKNKKGTNYLYIYTEYRKQIAARQKEIAEKAYRASIVARKIAKEEKEKEVKGE